MAAASPDSTVEAGALIAASATRPPKGAVSARAASASSATATIRPPPVAFCMMRPRWTITRTASSRLSAPATWAAATSPTL